MGVLLTQRDALSDPKAHFRMPYSLTSFSRSSEAVSSESNAVAVSGILILPSESDREPSISKNVNGKMSGIGEKRVHGLSSEPHRTCSK